MKSLILALVLSAVTASAHHNIERTYDLKKEVEITGTIRQLLLRNPHSFLQIDVMDQDGTVQVWSVEFPKGSNTLFKQGIRHGTLNLGDAVTLTINPSWKHLDKRGNMVALRRPSDGFEWSAKIKLKQS